MNHPTPQAAPTTAPADHEHLWDSWYPQDRNSHHRRCLIPGCGASQTREFKS